MYKSRPISETQKIAIVTGADSRIARIGRG